MRALRWDGTRLALARDAPDPRPGAGEALVRVHLAGICRTDLEITRGYLGFRGTPGHEWVGHVLAADDPRSEEHTSELQSLTNLVCRLLLEKKKKNKMKQSNRRTKSISAADHREQDRVYQVRQL